MEGEQQAAQAGGRVQGYTPPHHRLPAQVHMCGGGAARCSGTNAHACAQGMHLRRFYRNPSVPAGASRCTPSVPPSMLQISRSRSTHTAPKPAALNPKPYTSSPSAPVQATDACAVLSHAAPVDADMSGQYIRNGPPGLRWVHHTLQGGLFHVHQGLDLPPRAACFSVRLRR